MPLSAAHRFVAIPGPSLTPDAVLRAMHRTSPNIYEGDLVSLTETLLPDLCHVAGTSHNVAIYIGNGHAGWDVALANTVPPGGRVLVLITGRFGTGWAEVARARGIVVETLDFGRQHPADADDLAHALRADSGHQIQAVLVVHTDTASSVRSDITLLRRAMDEVGHPALLMVDCIASLGCDRFGMDACGADVVLAGSQKGLMVPPGLALVFVGPRARAARSKLEQVSSYWDWEPRIEPQIYYQHFGGTAPVQHLYGLRVALDMILAEGLEAIWARHETLARAVWAAVGVWGTAGAVSLNVASPAHSSHAVTSILLDQRHAGQLRKWCEEVAGVTLGLGLGVDEPVKNPWPGYFRIGHMGHFSAGMLMGVLGSVDAGFKALAIPHGAGALDAAAGVLADCAAHLERGEPLPESTESTEHRTAAASAPGVFAA